jgi:hypothetical protein
MAHAISMMLGTGNKVSVDYQSQEAHVTVTYELERHETDLQAVVLQKAEEIERLHGTLWRRIREIRTEQRAAQPDATADATGKNGNKRRRNASAETSPPELSKNGTGALPEAEPVAAESVDTATSEPRQDAPAPVDTQAAADRASEPQLQAIRTLAGRVGVSTERLLDYLKKRFGKSTVEDLDRAEAGSLLLELQRSERQRATATVAH